MDILFLYLWPQQLELELQHNFVSMGTEQRGPASALHQVAILHIPHCQFIALDALFLFKCPLTIV